MQVDPDLVDGDPQPGDVCRETPPDGRHRHPTRRGWLRRDADVLGVIALGGGLGSLGRYATARLLPTSPGGFPWSTLLVNVVGCVLIGVLMVLVTDVWVPRRYARPFLGIGFLGGLTTYSTMMLDLRTLGVDGEWLLAEAYLLTSLVLGLVAVWVGLATTRLLTRGRVPYTPEAQEPVEVVRFNEDEAVQ